MCAFVCAFELATKPQAGVLYREDGFLLTVQTQPAAPASKGPPIIAPTYSQRRMSLNVDHTIHQLWGAQRPSKTRTTDPGGVSRLLSWLKRPPAVLKEHLFQGAHLRTANSCELTRQQSSHFPWFLHRYLTTTLRKLFILLIRVSWKHENSWQRVKSKLS